MPELDLFEEANRQLVICNACRYCEGFCPVFSAIEIRRDFNQGDVFYLANLCHDCRACFYACMYSPPHEFAVNIPQILAQGRIKSYEHWSWPGFLARSFTRRHITLLLGTGATAMVAALSLLMIPPGLFSSLQAGPGAFYRIVPYRAMVIPALALTVYGLVIWMRGGFRFWSETDSTESRRGNLRVLAEAIGAICGLRYLSGGGPGCSYPGERASWDRRIYHSLVFWGFLSDFVSTTLAFIYQDLLHRLPPYSLSSAPVVFGAAGGAALIVGTSGLIWLKTKSDRAPTAAGAPAMDYTFLSILGLTALTGMLTFAFRSTPALGGMLVAHLALVAALFITAPYGKFVHALFRSLSLLKYYIEQQQPPRAA